MNKTYKNLIIAAAFSFVGFMCLGNEVKAKDHSVELNVNYEADKSVSEFDVKDITVKDVMPGDTVKYSINFHNNYAESADFFLEADVLKTLELGTDGNSTGAMNGAYTYSIVSTQLKSTDNPDGNVFSSDTIGGDSDVDSVLGLNQVKGKQGAYLSLGSVKSKGTGTVTVTIKLDGNTQDNSYMDQLGRLQFILGAEPTNDVTNGKEIVTHNNIVRSVTEVVPGGTEIVIIDDDSIPLSVVGNPQTGDSIIPLLICGIALFIGLALIILYFKMTKEQNKEVA